MDERVRQRLFAILVMAGSCFLLTRTIVMISQGNLVAMVPWAAALLLFETLIDGSWLVATIRWWLAARINRATLSLRLGAAAIILHAVRVGIYVLGRVGPWIDFDRRPEFRLGQPEQLFWVFFPAGMALLSVIAVVTVWRLNRSLRKRPPM